MTEFPKHRLTLVSSDALPYRRPSDTLDDLAMVAAGLSGYILADECEREDWQSSPFILALKRLAQWLRASEREVPPELAELLEKAAKASA
jgi:hypothetical protein